MMSRAIAARSARVFSSLLIAAGVALATPGAIAQSDTYVNEVNDLFRAIPTARRSDLLLLPALLKTAPAPARVSLKEDAALLPATSSEFAAAATWAQAPAQQEALKVLATITREGEWTKAYAFAQPYGADLVEPALVRDSAFTELGDPPTLAAAQHLYLPLLDRLVCLVNVEATRLAASGDPAGGLDILTNLVFFGRQMVDRPFAKEAIWGLETMGQALERIRDLAYQDMIGPRAIGTDRLRGVLQRLGEGGYTDLTRRGFPIGDRAGTEQILARVYAATGPVDASVFAPTMARLGSASEPLRLFAESSRWTSAAPMQADAKLARDAAKGIYADWNARWMADWFDKRQSLQPEQEKLNRQTMAAVAQSTPDLAPLLNARQITRTELVGTRASLAVIGYTYTQKILPSQLSAVRPLWIPNLENDPFNVDRRGGPQSWMTYMVPKRDTPKNERGEAVPYEIDVVTRDPAFPVKRAFTDDTFIIVSTGSNYERDFAKYNQNTIKKLDKPADYLIFPPVISLQREVMIARDALK
ncbi:MAG: hypothetical protein DYG92_13010 [Leptolyngbya sp. PLA1]|nr:hypothetical protein [Leptolyngbya sp. PLA1]